MEISLRIIIVILLIWGFIVFIRKLDKKSKTTPLISEKDFMDQIAYLKNKIFILEEKVKYLEDKIISGVSSIKETDTSKETFQHFSPEEIMEVKSDTGKIKQIFKEDEPILSKGVFAEKEEKADAGEKSIEMKVVGKWFLWIGVITILFGIAYFFKYAIDKGWISETMRVAMGLITGFMFLVAGKIAYKKYPAYSQGISGGGIAILYLSIFAGFQYYHIIDMTPAFAFMILVTLTSIILSVTYNSISLALLSLIGGFLTPILLSTGVDNQVGFLTYIAILDIGILILSYFKEWNILRYLSFFVTCFMFLSWGAKFYNYDKVYTTEIFLIIFYLIFAIQSFLQNVVKGLKTKSEDLFIMFLNAFVFYGASYYIMADKYFQGEFITHLTFTAIGMASFYFLQSYLALKKNKENKDIIMVLLGLTITFITIAIVVKLEQFWITIGWAVESIVLSFIGFKLNNKEIRRGGLVVLGLVLVRLIFWDTWLSISDYHLIFNKRTVAFIFGITAIFTGFYLYTKNKDKIDVSETNIVNVLATIGSILVFWILSAEVISYYGNKIYIGSNTRVTLEYARNISLSVVWSVYSMIFVWLGIKFKNNGAINIGFIALCLTVINILFLNTNISTNISLKEYEFCWSKRSLAFVFGIIAVFYSAYVLNKNKTGIKVGDFVKVLVVTGNIMILWFMSAEVITYFDYCKVYIGKYGKEVEGYKQMTISIVWALYSIVLMAIGIFKKYGAVRLMSIVIFIITILKVFVLDMAGLETIYRIISFIVLGIILMLAAFLYNKYKGKIIEFTIKS